MSDLFDAFDNNTEANFFDSGADPAAAFLAKEEAELARIENNDFLGTNDADPFGDFGKCLQLIQLYLQNIKY